MTATLSPSTLIETLHAAWVRTNAIYTCNDRATFQVEDSEAPIPVSAMKVLDRQMIDLGRVIMREMPGTPAEAVIVARHMANAADLIEHSIPTADDEDMKALNVATENLFVFLARNVGNTEPKIGAAGVDTVLAFERVAARTAIRQEG